MESQSVCSRSASVRTSVRAVREARYKELIMKLEVPGVWAVAKESYGH